MAPSEVRAGADERRPWLGRIDGPGWGLLAVLAFNAAFLAWLTLWPAPAATRTLVADAVQIVGPLAALPALAGLLSRLRRRDRPPAAGGATPWHRRPGRLPATALSLAAAGYVAGSAIWAYDELVLKTVVFPSAADAIWLACYLCFFLAVFTLPRRTQSAAVRTRVLLDGLLATAAAVAFSWYFLLGPTLMQGESSLLSRVVNAAYPLSDLVLVVCLLCLPVGAADRHLRRATRLLATAMLIMAAADTLYFYRVLHGTYASGGALDATWPLAYMLIGLAIRDVLRARSGADEAAAGGAAPPDDGLPLWRSLLPYALLPAVSAMAVIAWRAADADPSTAMLATGVYVGGAAFVALLLLRQVVIQVETRRLYRELQGAHRRQRAIELALREREAGLKVAQRIVHLGSWAWDIPADEVVWSDELYRIFGRAAPAFRPTYDGILECLHPDDRAHINQTVQRALADHLPYEADLRVVHPDGTERVILAQGSVVPDARGVPVKMVGTVLDVTEQRQAAVQLVRARDLALDASHAKSEFLANMSHEIRTPMNAILGMADLLADTPLSDEQAEYVGIFRRAGDTLLSLIDDILDLSKVEAGQLTLETTAFDLRALVEDAAEVLAVRAHAKGLELLCEVAPDVPAWVTGDPQRLRQVLLNLISNGVKFTERGEVHLRVAREVPGNLPAETLLAPPVVVRFSVRDTGIGIPAAQQAAVFGAFTQVDASTTRRYGGTGLGLAIVERLVALMGGRIAVESTPGQGATFAFSVPLEAGVAGGPALTPADPAVELAGARVLVVDDNATNRLILTRLLAPYGADVTEVDGGETALAALRAARAARTPYDLLLLDQQMPDLDGLQLVARVRAEAPDGAPGDAGAAVARAILMLSSDQRLGDAARARALGVTHYLIKPVKRAALLATIVTTLRQHAAPPGTRPAAAATALLSVVAPDGASRGAAPPRQRLLLVDDSADNRRLVQLYLRHLPYDLETAADGQAGLELFTAGAYDLVLMDVHMPVLDGLAATRALRAWERAQGRPPTPVVALTASVMLEDVRQAQDAGCDAHLAKPLKKATLLAALARYTAPGVRLRVPAAPAA